MGAANDAREDRDHSGAKRRRRDSSRSPGRRNSHTPKADGQRNRRVDRHMVRSRERSTVNDSRHHSPQQGTQQKHRHKDRHRDEQNPDRNEQAKPERREQGYKGSRGGKQDRGHCSPPRQHDRQPDSNVGKDWVDRQPHERERRAGDRQAADRSGRQQHEALNSDRQQQRRRENGRGGSGNNAEGQQPWGRPEEWEADKQAAAAPAAPKEGPNMGLSGKLAAETNKTVDGQTELKYQPPAEARVCKRPPWRLYCFKGNEEAAAPIMLNQTPFYLFGKDRRVADIPTDHPSCSRQHAVLVFREVAVDAPDGIATRCVIKPYLMDLESVNGTTINGVKMEGARYYELLNQDLIRFGLSSREYVIMDETKA